MKHFAISIFLLSSGLFLCLEATATKRSSLVNITSTYNTYSDLKLGGGEKTEIEPSMNTEIDFRLSYIFSFIIAGSQSLDAKRSEFGIGGRIDLPGFFFIGSNHRKDLQRQNKKYPVNTSVFLISSLTTLHYDDAPDTKTASSLYGFTVDWFLFNSIVYLSTTASLYNLQGNSFATTSIGLGGEF